MLGVVEGFSTGADWEAIYSLGKAWVLEFD